MRPGREDAEWGEPRPHPEYDVSWRLVCRHDRDHPKPRCEACLEDARGRLKAVARRAYTLSAKAVEGLHEAVYTVGGVVKREPFRNYALGDVDAVVYCLRW